MDIEKLEQWKKDCDMQDLATTKEYIEEAIATNEDYIKYIEEGHTRIQKCSLVALYSVLTELDNKDKQIEKLKQENTELIEELRDVINEYNFEMGSDIVN